MPNRILKESICASEKVSSLTDFQFRLWACLITSVDDYGRGDARPAIIKGRCFPLRDQVTAAQIDDALRELADAQCINLYEANGGQYFCFPNWEKHQTIRNKKSKFPDPPVDENGRLLSLASNCKQLQADVPVIQSNTNTNPNTNPEAEYNAATAADGLIAYASNNLTYISPTNMQELDTFREDLSDDMIRYAVDEACANGKRTYAYVRSILNRMIERGFKSLGEVKQAEEERKAKQAEKQTGERQVQAAQRSRKPMDERKYTDADFGNPLDDMMALMNRPRSREA